MCEYSYSYFLFISEPQQKMVHFRASKLLIVLSMLILSLGDISIAQQRNRMVARPFQRFATNRNKGPPMMCTHDTLAIYQDCRMCACPRPNRLAKCFRKSCDLRTKDSGQCPPALLRLDDWKLCSIVNIPGCKVDADCPGEQLCCFDFCGSPRCLNPVPLDATTGIPYHSGRGYQ